VPTAGRIGWHHGTSRWDVGEFFRFRIMGLDPVGRSEPSPRAPRPPSSPSAL
jgi:hypothetical protein